MHVKYPKVHHLNKDETDGIFEHPVVIQEKIDGANLSVWMEEDGLYVGSRNLVVGTPTQRSGFNGAVEYVNGHEGIKSLLSQLPLGYRLFGEWLVPHSIKYPDKYYHKFWMFDVMDQYGNFSKHSVVAEMADSFGILRPETFYYGMSNAEHAKQFVGRSALEVAGEGVVIKADGFRNKFGDACHAKIVSSEFKERNAMVFGNTHKDSEPELDFVFKFVNRARIEKIAHKIEQNSGSKISKSDTSRMLNLIWHDVFTEELWDYVRKERVESFDFKKAERISTERTKILFFDMLEGFNSVANGN